MVPKEQMKRRLVLLVALLGAAISLSLLLGGCGSFLAGTPADPGVGDFVASPMDLTTVAVTYHLGVVAQNLTITPAYGGSWGTAVSGTTIGAGDLTVNIPVGYTKTRVTLNQGSVEVAAHPSHNYNLTAYALTIKAVDHNGAGLTGAGVDQGGGYWQYQGLTDGSGNLVVYVFPGSYKFMVSYNGTSMTKTFSVAGTHTETFATALATVTLKKNCSGTPINGGVVQYANGSWHNFGTTGDNGAGTVTKELFPGTYKVVLTYNGFSNTIIHDLTTPFEFKTVALTIFGVTNAKYANGSWHTFTLPTMDLLPGTYRFVLDGVTQNIVVNGANCTQICGFLRLLDQAGKGVAGGVAQPAYGGSWGAQYVGSTDANGRLLITDTQQPTKIKMTINQGSQEQTWAQLQASNWTWYTVTATVRVIDHLGVGIAGAKIRQGGGTWVDQGFTDASGEFKLQMFPGSYKFEATVNSTSQQITQNIATPVVFQTGSVHSDSGTCTQYSTGSWRPFVQDMQLLPGNYTFTFTGFPNTVYPVTAGTVNHIH